MMKWMNFLSVVIFSIIVGGCGVYSFTGANVDGKTIFIPVVENKSEIISPNLSALVTMKLREKIQNQTKLRLVNSDTADIQLVGYINKYIVEFGSVQSVEKVSLNRLKIGINVDCKNRLNEKLNFQKYFERFGDFSPSQTLQAVESTKNSEIVEMLVDDIFNQMFSNW